MRILFITQKLHGQDAFGILWVREFIRQGFDVTVMCLEGPAYAKASAGKEVGFEFPVLTLGKEKGYSRLQSVLRFEKLIVTEKYDRVFIHMFPIWYALGFWWWMLRSIPVYLWYTHYKMQLGVRLFGWFGTRFFCATHQSLPQYSRSPKKTVVGHGIDLAFWPQRKNVCTDPRKLLIVHRLSRSKRAEIVIRALVDLDPEHTLDIYGIEAEKDYVRELHQLVSDLQLEPRVTFHGTIAMEKLPEIYSAHRLILNLASETIDKTMLEAMTCGCYPVTTGANAGAIGLPAAPGAATPDEVAAFVRKYIDVTPINADEMFRIVKERHSLQGLVQKMGEYISAGR